MDRYYGWEGKGVCRWGQGVCRCVCGKVAGGGRWQVAGNKCRPAYGESIPSSSQIPKRKSKEGSKPNQENLNPSEGREEGKGRQGNGTGMVAQEGLSPCHATPAIIHAHATVATPPCLPTSHVPSCLSTLPCLSLPCLVLSCLTTILPNIPCHKPACLHKWNVKPPRFQRGP